MTRREFVELCSASWIQLHLGASAHLPAQSMAPPIFRRIRLYSTVIAKQRQFYVDKLGFKLVSEDRRGFVIDAGASEIEFIEAKQAQPFLYHFAFNIPENRIQEALDWAQKRTPVVINKSSGSAIYDFSHWNAHAFYFLDPEGNIGEFIARHTMKNASSKPFGIGQVECVSELGVVTQDVAKTSQSLIDHLGLACYPDKNTRPGSEFQAIGSDQGLFIVVKKDRAWLGSARTASVFASEAVLARKTAALSLSDTLCSISG